MKICVLLPAYNEANIIDKLITDIRVYGLDIVVVDDGSTDNTANIAKEARACVLAHPNNLGKGQALRTGFQYIISNNYDGAIIMDADGQHLAEEIPVFLKHAQDSDAAILIGNRMHNPKNMPLVRKLTNIFTSYFISRIIGYKISDSQCGFRFIRTDVIKKINLSTVKYDTETEILIEAARNNFKIQSIPVKAIYANQKSQIQPVIDTIRFWSLIARSLIKKSKSGF